MYKVLLLLLLEKKNKQLFSFHLRHAL